MTSIDASIQPAPAVVNAALPNRRSALLKTVMMWTIIAAVGLVALYGGMKLRQGFFNVVAPIHFNSDNYRNCSWGYYTFYNIHDRGRSFLDTYDDVGVQERGRHPFIDYTPARLLVYTLWIGSQDRAAAEPGQPSRAIFPPNSPPLLSKETANHRGTTPEAEIAKWQQRQRDFWKWFVGFNTVFEIIGCVGAFLLTRQVVGKSGASPVRANALAMIAALLLWFNMAMILSAHGWPSGDMWVVPPFLWALYLCRRGNWALGGAALAVGALFKGQLFFVLPMFLLWPLLRMNWRGAAAMAGGFIGVFGTATCGWTLTHVDAEHVRHKDWSAITFAALLPLATVLLAVARPLVLARVPRQRRWVRPAVLAAMTVLAIAAALWPCLVWKSAPQTAFPVSTPTTAYVVLALFAVASALAVHFARRWQSQVTVAVGLFGAAALASMLLFSTCFAWFDAGYLYGTDHNQRMVAGLTSNLPGLMASRFGWDGDSGPRYVFNFDAACYTLGFTPQITLKTLLFSIYLLLLFVSSICVAMHDRRNSTRFLVAVVTPWVMFFTIPCQIHERYLLFAAAAASVCIGHSVGAALMGLFLTIVTWVMTIHVMLNNAFNRRAWSGYLETMYPHWFKPTTGEPSQFANKLWRFCNGTHPDIAWAIMLVALIFLWITLTPPCLPRRATPVDSPR
jgi:hypothetical protein